MRVERLSLRDYRNIPALELEPEPGVNIIYGDNAQGKTNLVEAIFLLTGQKSFRQSRESDFVRFGQPFARIQASFYAGGRSQTAALTMGGGKKTALLNDVSIQPSELTGRFLAVVFSPAELALVKDGPSERRAFLDGAISQVMPRYLKTLAAFSRAVSQRNSLLSDMARHPGMEEMLEVWDRSFARLAYSLINARCRYIARLSPRAARIYAGISAGREELSAAYQCTVPGDWQSLAIGPGEGEALILEALARSRREDLRCGYTTIGPQRDDLELLIGGASARSFGSQGQQRSCALTLKLAECALIEEVAGEKPVVLLDDVFSELDKKRRDYFLSGIHEGQVFITCCDRSGFRSIGQGAAMRVRQGELKSFRRFPPPQGEGPSPEAEKTAGAGKPAPGQKRAEKPGPGKSGPKGGKPAGSKKKEGS